MTLHAFALGRREATTCPARPEFRLTMPILLLCINVFDAHLRRAEPESRNVDSALREIYHAIPIAVPAIGEFW